MVKIDPSALVQFSEKEIKRTVNKQAVGHPLTLYPTVLSILTGAAALMFGVEYLCYASAAFFVLGPGNGIVRAFFMGEKTAQTLRQMQRIALEKESEREVERLQENLKKMGESRAAKQISFLRTGFDRFREKLDSKIGKEMREYEQYLGTAQQLFSAALHNLNLVIDNVLDMRTIDIEDSQRRIDELLSDTSRDNVREIEAQKKQIELVQQMKNHNQDLISEVEGAITAFSEITRSLTEVQTSRKQLKLNAEAAMKKFTDTAARNKAIYDKVANTWRNMETTF